MDPDYKMTVLLGGGQCELAYDMQCGLANATFSVGWLISCGQHGAEWWQHEGGTESSSNLAVLVVLMDSRLH